jgi:ankyrin repeat protein
MDAGRIDLERTDRARRLVEEATDGRRDHAEALHEAAAEGRREAAAILLDLGIPIDRPGQMGGTPLHHAAWWGHADVVAELLARGADPHLRAEPGVGGSALGWAAHGSFHSPGPVAGGGEDHERIAELLLEAGAGVEPDMLDAASAELADRLREEAERDLA